jgi:hypothetical protein
MLTRARLAALALMGLAACSRGPGDLGPAPTLSTVAPDAGPTNGATFLSVFGTDFHPGVQLYVGGVPAVNVNITGAFSLTASTPPGDAGFVDVRVVNPDGQEATLAGAFQYVHEPFVVTEAKLETAATSTDTSGANPVPFTVTADVGVPGLTDAGTPPPGLIAQAGWAPDTATDFSPFTWTAASYLGKATDPSLDRYAGVASLPGASSPTPQSYWVTMRFSVDGVTWTYADRLGAVGGTQFSQLSSVEVVQPAVSWCKTLSVSNSAPASGAPVTAHGLVVATGGTLRAQAGVGSRTDNPLTSNAWGWHDAVFDAATDAGADYVATVGPAYSGSRQLAFRFSVDDGGTWTYCDASGDSDGGYDPAVGWFLNVGVGTLDFCNLQSPATLTQPADGGTVVFGQVWVKGVTSRDAGDPLTAQLGWGQQQEDPGVSQGWTWVDAGYDTPAFNTRNNEYNAVLAGPDGGVVAYTFRYSVDGGPWCYGDLTGAGDDLDGAGQQVGFSGGASIGAATITP